MRRAYPDIHRDRDMKAIIALLSDKKNNNEQLKRTYPDIHRDIDINKQTLFTIFVTRIAKNCQNRSPNNKLQQKIRRIKSNNHVNYQQEEQQSTTTLEKTLL